MYKLVYFRTDNKKIKFPREFNSFNEAMNVSLKPAFMNNLYIENEETGEIFDHRGKKIDPDSIVGKVKNVIPKDILSRWDLLDI